MRRWTTAIGRRGNRRTVALTRTNRVDVDPAVCRGAGRCQDTIGSTSRVQNMHTEASTGMKLLQ